MAAVGRPFPARRVTRRSQGGPDPGRARLLPLLLRNGGATGSGGWWRMRGRVLCTGRWPRTQRLAHVSATMVRLLVPHAVRGLRRRQDAT